MNKSLSLFETAQRLKILLTAHATGAFGDTSEYEALRACFFRNSKTREFVPSCVQICRSLTEFWRFIQPKFPTYAERRRFLTQEFEPLLSMLEIEELERERVTARTNFERIDSAHIKGGWETALERLASDEGGAITAARALLETTCKYVLDECHVSYDTHDDLPGLYSKMAQQLNLGPNQQVEESLRRLMGATQQVVERIGTLRNLLGDAHGKGCRFPRC